MSGGELRRSINIPTLSKVTAGEYKDFLVKAWESFRSLPQYLPESEDINILELAHLYPPVAETVIAVYVGINDAVCNKGLVAPFLIQHGHNNVFALDPQIYPGGNLVPAGTLDAKELLNGFEPPNATWNKDWTYVMIEDPCRSFESLWSEKGYIDMIPAKFEDFTMLSDSSESKICCYIDPEAFEHPVNKARSYLKSARVRGEKLSAQMKIPAGLEGETDGLTPVALNKGEKLYVARTDFAPCAHCWNNVDDENRKYAVINENSAVPLDLVIAKPPVAPKYGRSLVPPKGSADMTTDWFYRGKGVLRKPLLSGAVKG